MRADFQLSGQSFYIRRIQGRRQRTAIRGSQGNRACIEPVKTVKRKLREGLNSARRRRWQKRGRATNRYRGRHIGVDHHLDRIRVWRLPREVELQTQFQ